jgi:peptide-methionine (S)-S-oxide reductase
MTVRSPILPRLLALAAILVFAGGASIARAGEKAHDVPPPVLDETAADTTMETALLAGGCFWGVQGVYQHVKGVKTAISGYAGGEKDTAHYKVVGTGRTGHAESVEITFDPRRISYGRILQIYFSVAHDPTQLNRQGPDVGTQYRSTIFPLSDEQEKIAKAYIAQLETAGTFDAPIVTTIEPNRPFYRAEDYHQDFLAHNPTYPYIAINDIPKVKNLQKQFPKLYSPTARLVNP